MTSKGLQLYVSVDILPLPLFSTCIRTWSGVFDVGSQRTSRSVVSLASAALARSISGTGFFPVYLLCISEPWLLLHLREVSSSPAGPYRYPYRFPCRSPCIRLYSCRRRPGPRPEHDVAVCDSLSLTVASPFRPVQDFRLSAALSEAVFDLVPISPVALAAFAVPHLHLARYKTATPLCATPFPFQFRTVSLQVSLHSTLQP